MTAVDPHPPLRHAVPAAVEITSFRLRRPASLADFVQANAEVDVWLRRQPGFRWRGIAQRQDQVVVDMLLWASAAEARDAMQRLMQELGDAAVHALIDQRTVNWSVVELAHALAVTGPGPI